MKTTQKTRSAATPHESIAEALQNAERQFLSSLELSTVVLARGAMMVGMSGPLARTLLTHFGRELLRSGVSTSLNNYYTIQDGHIFLSVTLTASDGKDTLYELSVVGSAPVGQKAVEKAETAALKRLASMLCRADEHYHEIMKAVRKDISALRPEERNLIYSKDTNRQGENLFKRIVWSAMKRHVASLEPAPLPADEPGSAGTTDAPPA